MATLFPYYISTLFSQVEFALWLSTQPARDAQPCSVELPAIALLLVKK